CDNSGHIEGSLSHLRKIYNSLVGMFASDISQSKQLRALADGVTYRARQESTADVSSGGKRSSNDQGRSTAAPAAGNPWDPILSLGSMIPDHGRATQAQSCRSLRKDGDDGDDDADLGQSQSVQRNIDEMKAKHEAHGPWAMARRIPPGEVEGRQRQGLGQRLTRFPRGFPPSGS
ncbi:hypothetical protein FOZ60_007959, partial [Perkinsus olseni]